jgi:hypothetical protein
MQPGQMASKYETHKPVQGAVVFLKSFEEFD